MYTWYGDNTTLSPILPDFTSEGAIPLDPDVLCADGKVTAQLFL